MAERTHLEAEETVSVRSVVAAGDAQHVLSAIGSRLSAK
jgi:hypothetical protein